MNLPQLALRRPLSIVSIAIAVGITSLLGWQLMPKDILTALNLPAIYVAQAYGGMDPAQMEGYLVYFFEYHFLYLTGIEHVESKSIQGAALMKLEFHPGTDMSQAMAETVAYVNRARAFMPPGTMPPLINFYVFILADNKAKQQPVKTGFNDGTNVEIVSGISLDDLVILTIQPSPRDGQSVKATTTN